MLCTCCDKVRSWRSINNCDIVQFSSKNRKFIKLHFYTNAFRLNFSGKMLFLALKFWAFFISLCIIRKKYLKKNMMNKENLHMTIIKFLSRNKCFGTFGVFSNVLQTINHVKSISFFLLKNGF